LSWQDLGSLGELVSAVVISLVYLVFQIRQNTGQINQNTKAVRAAAIDSSVGHIMNVRQAIFESEAVAHIFHAGGSDPSSLSEEELVRYRLMTHNVIWSIWNIFSQSRYAELPTEIWTSQIPLLARLLSSAGGEWFWTNYGHELEQPFQDEVRRFLEGAASQGSSTGG
jgi:hypothetical protein